MDSFTHFIHVFTHGDTPPSAFTAGGRRGTSTVQGLRLGTGHQGTVSHQQGKRSWQHEPWGERSEGFLGHKVSGAAPPGSGSSVWVLTCK